MTGGIATGPSSADSPSASNNLGPGASSTPIASFSSPMMTSPREEKPSIASITTTPTTSSHQLQLPHQQTQQSHPTQSAPLAILTSSQVTSGLVKEEADVKNESIKSNSVPVSSPLPSSINQESLQSPLHHLIPQVKVERRDPIPSSHSESYHQHNSSSTTVPPPMLQNSHELPRPPIKVILNIGSVNKVTDGAPTFGHRERSDSHGSSKNNSSSSIPGDTSSNSSSKVGSLKIKVKVPPKLTDEERCYEEERRKRKHEEVDRSSRRDGRGDDKRSKDRKHHR